MLAAGASEVLAHLEISMFECHASFAETRSLMLICPSYMYSNPTGASNSFGL